MRPELLDYLCCPKCRKDLALNVICSDGPQIETGRLACGNCGTVYPIERGIPDFLSFKNEHRVKEMLEGFEYEWDVFFKKDKPYFRDNFLQWVRPLQPADFRNKVILDAGCGMGRNTLVCHSFGPKAVIAFDIHDAVDILYRNSRHLANLHAVKADIFFSPFKPVFDIVYSVGVIHHTPQPGAAFSKIAELVKPDGELSIFVYRRETNSFIANIVSIFRIHLFSKLHYKVLFLFSSIAGALLYLFIRYFHHPLLKLASPVKKFLPYTDYLEFLFRTDFEYHIHVIFDHLVTPIASYHNHRELQEWYQNANFSGIRLWNRFGVTYVGYGKKVNRKK